MAAQRKDWERIFEDHFCHQLDIEWRYRIFRDSEIAADKDNCIWTWFASNPNAVTINTRKHFPGKTYSVSFANTILPVPAIPANRKTAVKVSMR